jgi:hypothetical protein
MAEPASRRMIKTPGYLGIETMLVRDGTLAVGGDFSSIGPMRARNIAQFDRTRCEFA